MKLDSVRLAHSLGILGALWYVVCWLLVSSMPMFYRGVSRSWMHGYDLSQLPVGMMNPGSSLYGLITFTVAAWITGYAFAAIYNALGKK